MADQKISSFTGQTLLDNADLFTFVRNSTNYNVKFSDLKNDLGVTGTLNQVGDPLAVPILEQPGCNTNNIRNLEDGAGVSFNLSAQNGIEGNWNVAQDGTGVPLTSGLTEPQPVMSSLVQGEGIIIDKVEDAITISAFAGTGGLNQEQIIYVAKAGDDTDSGLNVNRPKLTIGAAITLAISLSPSESNPVVVEVIDAGTYTETVAIPSWVTVNAPNAGIIGDTSVSDNSGLLLGRAENPDDTQHVIRKTAGIEVATVRVGSISVVGTNQQGIRCTVGRIHSRIEQLNVDAGVGIKAQSGAQIVFSVGSISLTNSGIGFGGRTSGGLSNKLIGLVQDATDDGTGILVNTRVPGDVVNIQGGTFNVNTLYDIGATGTLNMYASECTGAEIEDPTATTNVLCLDSQLYVEDFPTQELDDTNVLAPDGLGGVEWKVNPIGFFFQENLILDGTEGATRFIFTGEVNSSITLPLESTIPTYYGILVENQSPRATRNITILAQGGDTVNGTVVADQGDIIQVERTSVGTYTTSVIQTALSAPATTSASTTDAQLWSGSQWISASNFSDNALWEYDVSTVMADPGAGNMRFNNADISLATKMVVSTTTNQGADFRDELLLVSNGSTLSIREFGNFANNIIFTTDAETDNSTWFEVDITVLSSQAFSGAGVNLAVNLINLKETRIEADLFLTGGSETITTGSAGDWQEIGVPSAGGVSWNSDVAESFTVGTDGVITYTGLEDIDVKMSGRATVEKVGGGSDVIEVRFAINWNGLASDSGLEKSRAQTQNTTPTTVPIGALTSLVTNDNIRAIFSNTTGTDNIIASVSAIEVTRSA